MSLNPGIAERVAYGRPIISDVDPVIHTVPRPGTAFVGRVLIAAIFLVSGIAKLTDTSGTAAHMSAMGIPEAETLAVIAGLAEVLGATAIACGFLARLGALGLIVFMIPTTLIFHAFWTYEGAERLPQMVNFMKNLGLVGGLALIVAHGAGRWSIDAALRRPQDA